MSHFDAYFTDDDAVIKQRAYREFKLDKIDLDNLRGIEKALDSNNLNSNNSSDSLEYLEQLYAKITQIKANEYEYEGENNLNINQYLSRLKELISKIRRL